MKFTDCIEQCRDGKRYDFTHPNLVGFFHKAPFPHRESDLRYDGAMCAITYYRTDDGEMLTASPVMLLDDFDRDDWTIEEAKLHPMDR